MPSNFLWNTVCISSEAAVSDCEVLNFKTGFAFAKIIYICLVSVMWYMMQHVSDCIQVCVAIIQQHNVYHWFPNCIISEGRKEIFLGLCITFAVRSNMNCERNRKQDLYLPPLARQY